MGASNNKELKREPPGLLSKVNRAPVNIFFFFFQGGRERVGVHSVIQ